MHRGVDLLTVLRLLLLVLAARMINSFGEKKPQKARRGVSFGGSKIEALDPNLSPSENAVKILRDMVEHLDGDEDARHRLVYCMTVLGMRSEEVLVPQGLLESADDDASVNTEDESEEIDTSVHAWLLSQFSEVIPKPEVAPTSSSTTTSRPEGLSTNHDQTDASDRAGARLLRVPWLLQLLFTLGGTGHADTFPDRG